MSTDPRETIFTDPEKAQEIDKILERRRLAKRNPVVSAFAPTVPMFAVYERDDGFTIRIPIISISVHADGMHVFHDFDSDMGVSPQGAKAALNFVAFEVAHERDN